MAAPDAVEEAIVTTPQPRVIVPRTAAKGEVFPVKTIISHEMETGLRFDENGAVIPRKIINKFVCTLWRNGGVQRRSARGRFGQPLLEFFLIATESGRLEFVWEEDGGGVYSLSHDLVVSLRPRAASRRSCVPERRCRTAAPPIGCCPALRCSAVAAARRTIRALRSRRPARRVTIRPASDQGIPAIAGLDEQAIMRAMQAFRASEAPSHVMHAVALSLTDEELASVAHYLAAHGEGAGSP